MDRAAPGPSLLRDGLFLLSANTLNHAVAFAILLVAARLVPLADYGALGLAVALTILLATLLDFGSSVALVRALNAGAMARGHAAAAVLLTKLAAGGALLALAWALPAPLGSLLPGLAAQPATLPLALASAVLLSLWTSCRALEQAREDFGTLRRDAAACAVLRAGAFTVVLATQEVTAAAVLLCLYGAPLVLLLGGRALACVAPAKAGAQRLSRDAPKTLDAGFRRHDDSHPVTQAQAGVQRLGGAWRAIYGYGAWLGLSSLCFILLSRAPLFALGSAPATLAQAGLFSAALTMALAIGQLGDALRTVLLPRASRAGDPAAREALRHELRRRAEPLFAVAAAGVVLIALAYDTLLGPAHAAGAPLLLVLGLATLATAYLGLHNTLLHAHGRPQLDAAVNLLRLAALALLLGLLPARALDVALAYAVVLVAGELLLTVLVRRLDRPAALLAPPLQP